MPTDDIKCDRRAHIRLDKLEEQVTVVIKAFPHADDGADFDGHRKAHEAMIKAAEAQEAFWKDLKLDIAKKGAWGLIVILIGLVLLGISVKLGAVAKVV